MLDDGDEAVLERVAPGVFDHPQAVAATRAFLADPLHYRAVAIDAARVIGLSRPFATCILTSPAPNSGSTR
jgi:hypothetical protein